MAIFTELRRRVLAWRIVAALRLAAFFEWRASAAATRLSALAKEISKG